MIEAAVGFGANLGWPERTFAIARDGLAETAGVTIDAASSLWRSAPWGKIDQPEFANGVLLLSTALTPRSLLRRLQSLEDEAGRERLVRWGPRTLDLDLLWYGGEIRGESGLRLPHPGLAGRSFVLEPAAEIAPGWRHPETDRTVREMRDALRESLAATPCTRIEGSRLGALSPELSCRP